MFLVQPTLRLRVLAALIMLGRLPASCMRKGVKLRANLAYKYSLRPSAQHQLALESVLLEAGRSVARCSLIAQPMGLGGLLVGLIPNRRSTAPA